MKCHIERCKCKADKIFFSEWSKKEIGYCQEHAPGYIAMLKVGESTKPAMCMGIFKSWYKRIK
jgi:hypothetical protein